MRVFWYKILSLFGLPIKRISISGDSIPSTIHHKFFRLYPGAYNINWYVCRGVYEARFVNNDQVTDTYFKSNGEVIKQFEITNIKRVPNHIIQKITRGLSGYSIIDVLIDEYHDNPKYKITFRKEKKLIETDCDMDGNIINQIVL